MNVIRAPALHLRGVVKHYGDVAANDGIDLAIRWGEVHALLGENGAGKSTLVQIAYGFTRPDGGRIFLSGHEIRPRSPLEAKRAGIGLVFQRPALIPAFTVAENIALALLDLSALPDLGELARKISETAARYGLAVDPFARAGLLTASEQQRVEIVKVLLTGARILIFDEPTSLLSPHEVGTVHEALARLRSDGHAVLLITHKLAEAMAVAQRITVLRHGRVAGSLAASEATEARLLELMFGTAPAPRPRRAGLASAAAPSILELRGIATAGTSERPLRDVDLAVHAGEIVGVAGVGGNGQRELGDLILGIVPPTRGNKLLFGEDAGRWPIARVRRAGVAFIPEDPAGALVWSLTPLENEIVSAADRYSRWGGLTLDRRSARSELRRALDRLGVSDLALDRPTVTLSGGNLQRAVFAREIDEDTRLIVALYPTRGLDARTTAAAQSELLAARGRGAGILLFSQDLGELFAIADRILVMRGGTLAASFTPEEATPLDVGRAMTGEAA